MNMHRNSRMKRALTLLMLLVCLVNLLVLPASAAEVTGKITVSQKLKRNAILPAEVGSFYYRLTYLGDNDDTETVQKVLTDFGLYRNDDHKLEFTYSHAGIYTYRLEHLMPEKKADFVTYDKTVYIIRAYVTNEGNGLKVRYTVEGKDGEKVDAITFKHKYLLPTDVPDTGDQMNLGLYVGIMVLSAGTIIVLFLLKRKKKKEQQALEDPDLEESEEDEI